MTQSAGDENQLYTEPQIYEIAYRFRDPVAEVAIMELAAIRFMGCRPGRVLEIACGGAEHAIEWLFRDSDYGGLDSSKQMLDFARSRLCDTPTDRYDLTLGDLCDFTLDTPLADFAYVLLGSLFLESAEDMDRHFAAVARALRPGGLYFLDWCIDFDGLEDASAQWESEGDGYALSIKYRTRFLDRVAQTYEECVEVRIVEGPRAQQRLIQRNVKRAIFPQEFLCFLRAHPAFEFVGWWNDWNLERPLPCAEPVHRPITIIRRTG